MKSVSACVALLTLAVATAAQGQTNDAGGKPPPSTGVMEAKQRAAMSRFAPLAGVWRGVTVETLPSGTQVRTIAAHRAGYMLDGVTMELEGRSYNTDGTTAFHLMAILSYDPHSDAYAFRAYGRGGILTAVVHPTDSGYTFDRPDPSGATLHYTVTLGGGRWHEQGVRLVPGGAPVTVLDTDMRRVGATDWPSAGQVAFERP